MEARVSEIIPSVDAAARAYVAKIDLSAAPLVRSGLFGRAAFQLGTRKARSVPVAAVVERGQLQSVMVVEEGMARMRLVTLGERRASAVEVLSGLADGEKVVAPLPSSLADGARVEVRP
jgi:HlyD family secretion protein